MDKGAIIGLISLGVVIIVCVVIPIIVSYCKSPFKFPYKTISFDISGARQPNYIDYIDRYLIENKMDAIDNHMATFAAWKNSCKEKIDKSHFKKKRLEQYKECLDEKGMFIFEFNRTKTRYKQINYVRTPYYVTETEKTLYCSYEYLKERCNKLGGIGFETTLSNYHTKEQRKLITKELREQIAIRDNYTCQVCGKYMPDGVGLHIDHIIPVAKGGKSVPSNLQVLCSKCNGKKSNRIVPSIESAVANSQDTVKVVSNNNPIRNERFDRTTADYNYDKNYSDKLVTIEQQVILAYQQQNIDLALSLIKRAESSPKKSEQNNISLHFFYQNIVDIIYAMRTYYESAINDCLDICDKDIELLSHMDFGKGCAIKTVIRKAIILENQGKYQEAINLCDLAIDRGYIDNGKPFLIRKTKLENKLEKQVAELQAKVDINNNGGQDV